MIINSIKTENCLLIFFNKQVLCDVDYLKVNFNLKRHCTFSRRNNCSFSPFSGILDLVSRFEAAKILRFLWNSLTPQSKGWAYQYKKNFWNQLIKNKVIAHLSNTIMSVNFALICLSHTRTIVRVYCASNYCVILLTG